MNFSTTPTTSTSFHDQKPLQLGIIGLSHDHVRWIFERGQKGDIKIMGIAEANKDLADRFISEYKLSGNLIYHDVGEMLDTVKPEAVCVFSSIAEHLEAVRQCAPRGIHIMVEKPLSFSLQHALEMEQLSLKHNIHLLTNFQTSWYTSTHYLHELAYEKDLLGDVWKTVFHDGHKGPKERGCSKEFLSWLTDPAKNGGGAIIDFGCYGPNIMTWMMKGRKPLSVTAFTQTIKPEMYPEVDDEAIIILEYHKSQALIQASWNWPINRKDIEIYGKSGQLFAEDSQQIRLRKNEDTSEEIIMCPLMESPYDDPFSYLAAVVSGRVQPQDYDLSSLKLNIIVVEILEAAIESAKSGKKIFLNN